MFDEATLREIEGHAARLNIDKAALQAVIEVESAGHVFAQVNGRPEPLIRWEGHYFDRRLKNGARERARKAGLAHPKAGGVPNPRSQAARWELVKRAASIDRQAALESFSIGLGQVMTAHWRSLGFARVDDLIALARRDGAGQVDLMVRYIEKFGLVDELQRLDFTGFARGYNGPGFAKHGYHTKMAATYRRLSGKPHVVSKATGMLRQGSRGARVRELQGLLVRAGYAIKVDGDFGPSTKAAVMAFQKDQAITVDGVAGPETFRRLETFKQAPEEKVGQQGVTETKEAKEGIGGIGGGVAIEVARQQVQEVADKVTGIAALEWLSTILSVIAALLVIGGLAWIAWGWWKARRTDEGDVEPVEIGPVDDSDPVLA